MGIATMADIARIVDVNEAARAPEARNGLFQRVNQQHDLEAFEILYHLYFGDTFEKAFHQIERRAMQKVLAESAEAFFRPPYENIGGAAKMILEVRESPSINLLDKMLTALEAYDSRVSEGAKTTIALCLLKFLSEHPDFFELFYGAGVEKRLKRLCSPAEVQRFYSQANVILRNVLAKARARCKLHRATS